MRLHSFVNNPFGMWYACSFGHGIVVACSENTKQVMVYDTHEEYQEALIRMKADEVTVLDDPEYENALFRVVVERMNQGIYDYQDVW